LFLNSEAGLLPPSPIWPSVGYGSVQAPGPPASDPGWTDWPFPFADVQPVKPVAVSPVQVTAAIGPGADLVPVPICSVTEPALSW
jgi:hypothetical protein